MWIPIFNRIVNFMSHSDTTFTFINNRVVMIKGENNYDKKPKSNGSGKSCIIEGLSVAFTGEVMKSILTPDIIKDGAAKAEIFFEMKNIATGDTMRIERTLYRDKGTSAKLRLYMNGSTEPKKFVKVANGNDFILECIGISKVDLYNYYIVSKKKYKSFYYSSDGEKRKLISRFSKADMVDGAADEINKDVKAIEDSMNELRVEKSTLDGKILAYNEQLESDDNETAKADLILTLEQSIINKNASIVKVREEIKLEDKKLIEAEALKKSIDAKIVVADKELALLKPKDFDKDKKKLKVEIDKFDKVSKEYNEQIGQATELLDGNEEEGEDAVVGFNAELKEKQEKLADIEKRLLAMIECPECEHQFFVGDETDLPRELESDKQDILYEMKDIEANIDETASVIYDLEQSLKANNTNMNVINNQMRALEKEETLSVQVINNKKREITSIKTTLTDAVAKINKIKSTIQSKNESIELTEESIKTVNKEIKEIKERKDADVKKDIRKKIKTTEAEIIELDEKIAAKDIDRAGKAKFVELYKRFNVKLSNMAIKSIEGISNQILSKMDSNLTLCIDGYKVNRDGSVSDVITTNVMRYGVYEGSFYRFSEGEQATMNVSTILAMQQLINMGCKSGGLDMLFIDEVTESLDSHVICDVVKSLDMVGRTVGIITHVSDEAVMIPHEIIIEKTMYGSHIKSN